ncbi:MAG: SDR family oxidoreductase [Deltaproteobacteria bacterium]|nr:MAG: SDR family oxidoreductase [Deltaproteobacteria bacterium]
MILGASSGFGAACARALAAAGYDILGVHLDRRAAMEAVDALVADLRSTGRSVRYFNTNAAADDKRAAVIDEIAALLQEEGGSVEVFLHSLAFGTLTRFIPQPAEVEAGGRAARGVTRRQLEMTLDVMANSLVYWTQDLVLRGLMGEGGRIFSLSSSGSHRVMPHYGPVSAAKAALESHSRQLACELASRGITVNVLMPGVTDTPALRRIPGHEALMERARAANPFGRLTTPEDVADCLVALCGPGTRWLTGEVIRVDGGEDVMG